MCIRDSIYANKLLDDDTFYDLLVYFCDNIDKLSIQNLQNMISYSIQVIMNYHSKVNTELRPDWVDKMNYFIEQYYADYNLNVSIIADSFGLNRDYASRVYKQCTGISIMDKLHNARLQRAQFLLSQNYSTLQVSEMVGYNTVTTFCRSFKKYIGCTPKEYRNASFL